MKICTKTVMDTTDPLIKFDDKGICNHYHQFKVRYKTEVINGEEGLNYAKKLSNKIKIKNKKKKYDCIIGLSGGVDSSYVAYVVKEVLGLRPLAIHMDNGWNSELAVSNIEKIIKILDIDLHTEVLNWEEFRELQKAFFRASVGNVEMVTDHAINATLFKLAKKYNINNIISGTNVNCEGILQLGGWAHDNKDWINIKDINKKHGKIKLKTYPFLSPLNFTYSIFIKGVRFIPILNYFTYNKSETLNFLKNKLEWRQYGRKHGESLFTRFFQEYYLPDKFKVDKRKSHLSSLICANQISRDDALLELKKPLFEGNEKEELIDFIIKKLQFSQKEWNDLMKMKPVSHNKYKTSKILSSQNNYFYKLGRKIATGRNKLKNECN